MSSSENLKEIAFEIIATFYTLPENTLLEICEKLKLSLTDKDVNRKKLVQTLEKLVDATCQSEKREEEVLELMTIVKGFKMETLSDSVSKVTLDEVDTKTTENDEQVPTKAIENDEPASSNRENHRLIRNSFSNSESSDDEDAYYEPIPQVIAEQRGYVDDYNAEHKHKETGIEPEQVPEDTTLDNPVEEVLDLPVVPESPTTSVSDDGIRRSSRNRQPPARLTYDMDGNTSEWRTSPCLITGIPEWRPVPMIHYVGNFGPRYLNYGPEYLNHGARFNQPPISYHMPSVLPTVLDSYRLLSEVSLK
ncbi:hypothetical protein LOTGIDRAFT_168471 [Lottia gigantea]|uniref:Uncharacterized protein n=1 Tax=Lottia gigantea TaxID=225164 RepID=V3ZV20_LOTGI|nr:hypothetical protein LOTGIDRAFT_168471 [Lottia gigantea]ESO84796.1 hypothetical protein LOTGIDRAFT_168471 [Lottia gigantea]